MIIAKRYCIISGQMKKCWCGSMAEQLIRNEQVDGSIPFTSSKKNRTSVVRFFFFNKISRILRKQRNDRASQKTYRAPFTRLLRENAVPLSRGTERLCRSADVVRRLLFGDVFCSRRSAVCSAKTPSVVFKHTKKSPFGKAVHALAKRRLFLRNQPFSL